MARNPLPPGEKKELFNCLLEPATLTRLKIIAFRRSIHRVRQFSEGEFVRQQVLKEKLPSPPTPAQIEAYIKLYPKYADKIRKLAALTPPKLKPDKS